jgi:hypothetical protein
MSLNSYVPDDLIEFHTVIHYLEKDGVEGGEGADTFGVSGKYSYNRGQASIIITHPARRSPKK